MNKKLKSNETVALSKKTGFLISGRLVAFLFNFILPVVLVRIFDKQQFGVYRQLLLIHITFFPILQMGISQSLYYFYPREAQKRGILIQQSLLFLLFTGMMFFLIIFIFGDFFELNLFHNDLMLELLPLIALYTGLMVPASLLEILLIVEGRVGLASLITALSAVVKVGLVLLFAFLIGRITYLIIALVFFSGMRLFFLIFYFVTRYKNVILKFNFEFFKEQLLYAIPFGMAVIMVTLNMTVDKFAISFLYLPSLFAVYSIGCYQVPIISITINAALNIILPQITIFQKENKTTAIIDLWHRTVRKLALIGYPTFVFFLVFANEFITFLFTSDYVDSILVFRIFLFLILINATMYGVVLRAYGKTAFIFKSSIASFFIALVFIYPASKFLGLKGAAFVVVFSHALHAIIQLFKTRSLLKIRFSELLPWRKLLTICAVSCFSVLLLIPIKYLRFLDTFHILIISVILFAILYTLFIWNVSILTNGEKIQIKRFLSRIYRFFYGKKSFTSIVLL